MMHARQEVELGAALRSFFSVLGEMRYSGVHLISYNLLWVLVSLPGVTFPAATVALYATVNEFNYRRPVDWRDFFRFMRQYFWAGWRWVLINAVVGSIIALNLWFYASFEASWAAALRVLWVGLALGWTMIQAYSIPVLLEQEEPRVVLAMRNAFVLFLRYPAFLFTHSVLAGLLALGSVIVPYFWVIFLTVLIMLIHARAIRYLMILERGGDLSDLFGQP